MADRVNDDSVRTNSEDRPMRLATQAVRKLPYLDRYARVFASERTTVWVVFQAAQCRQKTIVPALSLLRRSILRPPARGVFQLTLCFGGDVDIVTYLEKPSF